MLLSQGQLARIPPPGGMQEITRIPGDCVASMFDHPVIRTKSFFSGVLIVQCYCSSMASRRSVRRWIGGLLLAAAVGMLFLGQTVLKARLVDKDFVIYWLVCFLLTGVAAIVALVDFFAVKRDAMEQQKELLDETVENILSSQDEKDKED